MLNQTVATFSRILINSMLSCCESVGKLGQTSTNFQVKRGKSASIMGIDDSLPGNAAPHLEFFD
jgi:hypothetical protein